MEWGLELLNSNAPAFCQTQAQMNGFHYAVCEVLQVSTSLLLSPSPVDFMNSLATHGDLLMKDASMARSCLCYIGDGFMIDSEENNIQHNAMDWLQLQCEWLHYCGVQYFMIRLPMNQSNIQLARFIYSFMEKTNLDVWIRVRLQQCAWEQFNLFKHLCPRKELKLGNFNRK